MKKLFLFVLLGLAISINAQINSDSINSIIDTCKTTKGKLNALYDATKDAVLKNTDYEYIENTIASIVNKENTVISKAQGFYYLGYIYYKQEKLNEAISNFFKALPIAEQEKNQKLSALIHNRLGNAYKDLKNPDFAKKHYRHALDAYHTAGLKEDVSEMCNLLGTMYKNENVLDSALLYHKKALEIRLKLGDKKLLASTYNNLGLVYKKKKDYDLALNYLKLALNIRKEIKDKKGTAGASINIGNVLIGLDKNSEALQYIKEGTELAYSIGAGDFYKNGLEGLSDCYFNLGDYKLSSIYRKRYVKVNDSLSTEEINKQISELSAQYESGKKDAELQLQEEKLKTQQSEIKKQKLFILSVVVVLLLVLLLIFFVYRSYRINKKNAIDLARKNIIIEQKNKEITDSINYARRIQASLLPAESIISKHLHDYFILYRPKDIVSGDFFWFYAHPQKQNCFLLAVADCTGHGVPGAFMSLIGKEKLDKAVTESDSPSKILNCLNVLVKASLQQDSNQVARDGMDIALIQMQFHSNGASIKYAGANRPLWIIRKDTHNIEETKATKHAIAGFTEEQQQFEEHNLELQKGDSIYLFTDGYADQFGGELSKKLTSKSLKKLLLAQQHHNMNEQRMYYTEFIDKWMSGQEQVDDILLLGIKI